jgi:hypothetical protein
MHVVSACHMTGLCLFIDYLICHLALFTEALKAFTRNGQMVAYVGKKLISILVLLVRKRLNLNVKILQSLSMASIDPSVYWPCHSP